MLVSKFGDHVPPHCQSEMYAREGIDLDFSTLADWEGAASELIADFCCWIMRHVLACSKIHADDTDPSAGTRYKPSCADFPLHVINTEAESAASVFTRLGYSWTPSTTSRGHGRSLGW
jgi:hypothetical protein